MNGRSPKERLDVLLVNRGLAETRTRAQALIMAGLVEVNGTISTKAGTAFPSDVLISLKERLPYVSRGGLKLEGALKSFPITVEHKVCLDVGASTGGFTDCLLQHGARKVYAVDVGHGQIHPKIAQDPRVVNIEKMNFRYFDPQILKDPVEFCTIDVSFISLELILPMVIQCLIAGGEVLAMVKPQFESTAADLKKGVVKDDAVRERAIARVRDAAVGLGFVIMGSVDAPIKGPRGNLEHFLWMKTGGDR